MNPRMSALFIVVVHWSHSLCPKEVNETLNEAFVQTPVTNYLQSSVKTHADTDDVAGS